MTTKSFEEYVKSHKLLNTEEIHCFMDDMNNKARCFTLKPNVSYHAPAGVRNLLSELFRSPIPPMLRIFPPFYTDSGKDIVIGDDIFISACRHFQDHGGVTIGDSYQIGHNVVLVALSHGLAPEDRGTMYPAPIVLGKNVWIGANVTTLPGVMTSDDVVIAAEAVVTKDVSPNVTVGGAPAKFIESIAPGQG